jgi:trans-aconitate methyltransferase
VRERHGAIGSTSMTLTTFRDEPLAAILAFVEAAHGDCEFAVLDPDRGAGKTAGERVEIDGVSHVHRPLRAWLDLAERLGLHLATPRREPPLVVLRFSPLPPEAEALDVEPTERYGAGSTFARIHKLEDPRFVLDLREALARARLPANARVLDLGVNTGDELDLVYAAMPDAVITGVDHSASALAIAARHPRFTAVCADLAAAVAGDLGGRFDLAISIATLQSPGIDDREVLRRVIQDHLTPTGAVILGIPNGRHVGGDISYGARMRNFAQPELGLLVKDVAFYRKYLQQHHRQVFVTGKHYVFVTGVAGAASGSST